MAMIAANIIPKLEVASDNDVKDMGRKFFLVNVVLTVVLLISVAYTMSIIIDPSKEIR